MPCAPTTRRSREQEFPGGAPSLREVSQISQWVPAHSRLGPSACEDWPVWLKEECETVGERLGFS